MQRYDDIGRTYSTNRQTDPRWATRIHTHVDGARRVLNVGAGTGSYEPTDPAVDVVAVEPSAVMVAQRSPTAAPAVRASGGTALPFPDSSFHAVMAVLTVHHWGDWATGLNELRRLAPLRVVLAIDFEAHANIWFLRDYLPEVAAVERTLTPSADQIAAFLPASTVIPLPLADPAVVEAGVARLAADLDSGAWADTYADLLTADTYDAGYRLVVSDERTFG